MQRAAKQSVGAADALRSRVEAAVGGQGAAAATKRQQQRGQYSFETSLARQIGVDESILRERLPQILGPQHLGLVRQLVVRLVKQSTLNVKTPLFEPQIVRVKKIDSSGRKLVSRGSNTAFRTIFSQFRASSKNTNP